MPAAAPGPAWQSRLYDLPKLIKAKPQPTPWRVKPLAIDGTLAVVAGRSGAGKTWVMHEAADAVARGRTNAGMAGTPGLALIIDAEMGEWLTVDRFRSQGYSTDIVVMDAQGLDLSKPGPGRELIDDMVFTLKPRFIGIDSLKALTPGGKENESDSMGPPVNYLRGLVSKVRAAGVLIHHAGWKEERTRGSSAIRDRVDAVWYLSSPNEEGVQRFSCQGPDLKAPRWMRPPADLHVRIKPDGGLEATSKPAANGELMRDKAVAAARAGTHTSLEEIAQAIGGSGGKSTKEYKLAKSMKDNGEIVADKGRLVYVESPAV